MRVLIPTTGVVGAADIAAVRDLRLIAQPAAGYNNIDVEAAKRRGVPVTIAPGGCCNGPETAGQRRGGLVGLRIWIAALVVKGSKRCGRRLVP